jgi:hypothetical protein
VADFPAEADQVQMRGRVHFGLEERRQVPVRLLNRHSHRSQADSAAHTVDVCIHRKGGSAQGKLQHYGSCLRTDTVELHEPCARILDG